MRFWSFDEVITGLRVARGAGAKEVVWSETDLTVLGKIIGGRIPSRRIWRTREIMDQLSPVGPGVIRQEHCLRKSDRNGCRLAQLHEPRTDVDGWKIARTSVGRAIETLSVMLKSRRKKNRHHVSHRSVRC